MSIGLLSVGAVKLLKGIWKMTFFGREPDNKVLGCGNHGCKVKKPTGMATNGPCTCETAAERMQSKIVFLERELEAANKMIAVLRAENKFQLDSRERERRKTADDFERGYRE